MQDQQLKLLCETCSAALVLNLGFPHPNYAHEPLNIGLFLSPKFDPGSVITKLYSEVECFHLKICYLEEPTLFKILGKSLI